ncbi:lytic transglycosylase domain-containing protein [Algoriphagus sp. CAU 1675]|uniref:lytic transglycosylase domain-containing protein n=1 Tax=Algoriphagus sp. CAU 1675 TaxID=3032597 RepID=UPI0023DCE38A|nr:lytic transglycosylase domain-containing protein [Algoriphagus sp. CAU 1675]MDF2156631.1 lytic transglycosylase domain-containing protein [Algoriphagus sp. CAU 1675]
MKKFQPVIHFSLTVLCLVLIGFLWFKPSQSPQAIPFSPSVSNQPMSPLDSIRIFEIPKDLTFAGEKVPLEIQDVFERLEREIYVNAYWQSNMILLMKRSGKYLEEIEEILRQNEVPEDLKYLAIAESGLMNVASPAGAKGFWQFMESTGKEYGLEINRDVDERYHFQKSTVAATKYLKKAHEKFGNWTAVAASYNMGQNGFSRRQQEQLQDDYYHLLLNEETSRYMFRILAFKVIFENPQNFGFSLRESDYYQTPPLKTIQVNADIKNLAEWAKSHGSSYKDLKLYNPWLRDKNLNVRRGKTYELILPEY